MQHGESSDSGKIAIRISHFEADQVLTIMDGHLPSQRWSPTIQRMVTQQEGSLLQTRNLARRLSSQNYDQVRTAMDGHLPSLGWSHTNPTKVTHQKEVHYRLVIWHLDITHRTKTFQQLPLMVTYISKDDHPSKGGNILQKKFFDQRPGSRRNNSISC